MSNLRRTNARTRVLHETTIREFMMWWTLCIAIWIGSLSQVTEAELIIASLSALPCALLAVQARRLVKASWRFRANWFLVAIGLPREIVTGYFRAMGTVLRRSEGEFVMLDIEHAKGGTYHSAGRRALSLLLINLSPASYVLDIDPQCGRTLVHSISRNKNFLERVVGK